MYYSLIVLGVMIPMLALSIFMIIITPIGTNDRFHKKLPFILDQAQKIEAHCPISQFKCYNLIHDYVDIQVDNAALEDNYSKSLEPNYNIAKIMFRLETIK